MFQTKRYALLLTIVPMFAACSDSTAPSWPDGAELTLSVDENAIVAQWPEATDDTAVVSYSVSVDGTPAAESGSEARNFKAMDATLGQAHEFAVIAKDAAGNETPPLKANWEARDMSAPEWPVGKTVKVSKVDPQAEPAEDGSMKLRITWPNATDDGKVEFYRVMQVPTQLGGEILRPKLIGLVKTGDNDIETKGQANTKFQVYAVDDADNTSKPLIGSLDNPTRLDPTKKIRPLSKDDKTDGATPAVNKKEAREKMAN